MRRIGFSTGALAKGDFREGIRLQESCVDYAKALELSALREDELDALIEAIPDLDLSRFEYVSFHAPSSRVNLTEPELIDRLKDVATHIPNIIVHPDIIEKPIAWRTIEAFILLENMDQRKPIGRTTVELKPFFDLLPRSRLCLDIGHARQVDPTLSVAVELLRAYATHLAEIHISEVNAASKHVPISSAAKSSFRRIAKLIPREVPVIIESSVAQDRLEDEVQMALSSLGEALPVTATVSTDATAN